VVFGKPVAVITPALRVAGKIERVAQGLSSVAALRDWREIEDGKGVSSSKYEDRPVRRPTTGAILALAISWRGSWRTR
jgi:hypothetical protein